MIVLESWLPHRSVAVLITHVATQSAATLTAEARVPAAHPLVRAGRAPAILAVEAAAQATALVGATATAGPAARAYVVGVPRCALDVADLAADAPFEITVEHLRTEGPLSRWSFRATRDTANIATGEISIWCQP